MLKVKVEEDLILKNNLCSFEPQYIEMEIDSTNVKYFKAFTIYNGLESERRNLVYWGYYYQKITDVNYYDYIKANVTEFKEYIDKHNAKYLINMRCFAGIEKHSWGIFIKFTDGDAVSIEL